MCECRRGSISIFKLIPHVKYVKVTHISTKENGQNELNGLLNTGAGL